ncbi:MULTISPECIES: hypothetical protein [unclassified Streptomyces]|uniref:hypothetical protein n=1 Tax=unclassified Streptomyces TaxID=2593676 RepID=UPI00364DF97D
MAKGTTPRRERESGAKMTIRVYSVNRGGAITEDRGTLSVMAGQEPEPTMGIFPPCNCPRHRGQRLAL